MPEIPLGRAAGERFVLPKPWMNPPMMNPENNKINATTIALPIFLAPLTSKVPMTITRTMDIIQAWSKIAV